LSQFRALHIAFSSTQHGHICHGRAPTICFFFLIILVAQLLSHPCPTALEFQDHWLIKATLFMFSRPALQVLPGIVAAAFFLPRASEEIALPCRCLSATAGHSSHASPTSLPHAISPRRTSLGQSRRGAGVFDRIAGNSHVHSMRKAYQMAGSRPDWRIGHCGGISGRKSIPRPHPYLTHPFYSWYRARSDQRLTSARFDCSH